MKKGQKTAMGLAIEESGVQEALGLKHSKPTSDVQRIAISKIVAGENSRGVLKDHELGALVTSIENQGLLQPIGVTPIPSKPGFYSLVYGSRRFKACEILGWPAIDAVIQKRIADLPADRLLQNAAENWVRSAPSFVEQGKLFNKLFSMGMSQQDISKRTGMSESLIQKICYAYRKLPKEFTKYVIVKQSGGKRVRKELPVSVANTMVTMVSRQKLSAKKAEKLYHHVLENKLTSLDIDTMEEMIEKGGSLPAVLKESQKIKTLAIFVKVDMARTMNLTKAKGFSSPRSLAKSILKKGGFPIVD